MASGETCSYFEARMQGIENEWCGGVKENILLGSDFLCGKGGFAAEFLMINTSLLRCTGKVREHILPCHLLLHAETLQMLS